MFLLKTSAADLFRVGRAVSIRQCSILAQNGLYGPARVKASLHHELSGAPIHFAVNVTSARKSRRQPAKRFLVGGHVLHQVLVVDSSDLASVLGKDAVPAVRKVPQTQLSVCVF
jgi:hypothetical protein